MKAKWETEIMIVEAAEEAQCERWWQEMPAAEQRTVCEKLTDAAMAGCGYERLHADD